MLPSRPAPALKWYYRPGWVLLLLFVVLGPFGLPYLWKSPSFSRSLKVVLTVLLVAYMALFAEETIRAVRAMNSEMHALGGVADF
jgi:predicted membrane channel-forming protein YqfA (hemolysin III family)